MTSRSNGRVTIADIARRAGVSKGAVSYALNGRPGLSEATRARILAIADEMGWYPNRAARALSAARADACGLVLARPAKILGLEPFFMDFISGVESELAAQSKALTLQLVRTVDEEVSVYRRWWSERRVDGVLMVDPRVEDPRVNALVEMGLPAVVIGSPGGPLPAVWHNEGAPLRSAGTTGAPPMTETVRYLAALGHTRLAYVAGVGEFVHAVQRFETFRASTAELGVHGEAVATDYTPESGARATRKLLLEPEPPTALIYDSPLLAVTVLGVVQHMGLAVPDDISIVGWDAWLFSQVVPPPLTSITRDIHAYGVIATRRLLDAIDGLPGSDIETPRGELLSRASTARAPRPAAPRV